MSRHEQTDTISNNNEILYIDSHYKNNNKRNKKPEYFKNLHYNNVNDKVAVIVKWVTVEEEETVFLNDLLKLNESYMYDLFEWIHDILQAKSNVDNAIQAFVESVWMPTASQIPIGSLIEIMNSDDNNDENKSQEKYIYGLVVGHRNPKIKYDFEWRMCDYKNNIIKIIDTTLPIMKEPISPESYDKNKYMSSMDIHIVDINNNDDLTFSDKYSLLKQMIYQQEIECLKVLLNTKDRIAKESYLKQLEIAVDRIHATLQPRFKGQSKTINIAFNANFFFHYLLKSLKDNNIKVHKRGYVYTASLSPSQHSLLGPDVDLTNIIEPNADTFSDGSETSARRLQLIWSNYSLKLKVKYQILVIDIHCPAPI